MSKWISVKDKLPDKDGSYLCYIKVKWSNIGYMEVCKFALNLEKVDKYDFYRKRRSGWYEYDGEYGYYEHNNITHWQPLPKPPEEERERMTDMLCSKCDKHYIGKGWFCWSGNKSNYRCNNGNPNKDRILYNSRKNEVCTERELVKRGVIK